MIALLNSLFGSLSPLWEMSLTAAYVTAVVAVLRLILKKRAPKQVLCLLWLVVFARLLVPVSPESPLSILPDGEQVQLAQELPSKLIGSGQSAPAQKPPQNPVHNQPGTAADPVSQGNGEPGAVPVFPALAVPEGVTSGVSQAEAQAGFPWRALLAGVWLAGAAAMCLYGLASYLSLKSCLYDAIRAEDGAWEHPAVRSPFILGMLRPKIYLPAGLWGMPRQFILCHERAHLRRLDHIVKPVCWLALALHWFNPAVWAAFILMSRDIEAACDEAVIRRLGPKVKADYSATLLSLATNGRAPSPCPLAFDEGNAKTRINNVLRYRRPALWIVVVSAVMAVMAAVCLLTDPVSAKEPAPDPDASQSEDAESLNHLLDPWMLEVLEGERSFRSGSEEYRIDQLRAMVYGDEFPELILKAGKLTVMDLDKDGVNELVVWPAGGDEDTPEIGYTVGYFIFRRQGDTVYGYNPGSRLCNTLKADGTFSWAGSSYYWGFGSARFTENGFEIENITWCDATGDGEQYFVNGLKATQEEFDAATGWGEQNRKPEPTWYVFEDGQLRDASANAAASPDGYDSGLSAPDFLDDEQLIAYYQAYIVYSHFFGLSTEDVDPNGYGSGSRVEYNGAYYWPATGAYANWDDFEAVIRSVFTETFWNERNQNIYVNLGGTMHYMDVARGGGGYNENFPETFQLVEKTDDAVSFIMTGYYSDARQFEGITDEQREAWLAAGWEYSIEFPMRMVKTEDGWRFDKFYNARTDNGLEPSLNKPIPNPNAPAPPSVPGPSASPEPVVVSELDGMQLLSVGNRFQLTWQGQTFPVGPDISYGDRPWLEDFDEDGQPEALFYGHEDGSYPFTVYDIVDGALVGSPLPDIETEVYSNISLSSVAAYNPATGGLTMTFPWGEGDSRRYVSLHTTLPSDFFAGCEELAAGQPLRMQVTPGSINGMGVPRGLSYRASVALTDGTTTSPEVGYLWFGVLYSDSGFEVRTPEESDFGTDMRA